MVVIHCLACNTVWLTIYSYQLLCSESVTSSDVAVWHCVTVMRHFFMSSAVQWSGYNSLPGMRHYVIERVLIKCCVWIRQCSVTWPCDIVSPVRHCVTRRATFLISTAVQWNGCSSLSGMRHCVIERLLNCCIVNQAMFCDVAVRHCHWRATFPLVDCYMVVVIYFLAFDIVFV